MTGRYPMRYGLQTLVIFPSHTYGLAIDERTLPQALKDGYKTLMVGRWHLRHADKKYWPQNQGFDYFYGNAVGEVENFTRERCDLIDWQRNGTFLKEKGYYTDFIGDDAIKLIGQQDGKTPFFLYFASLAPHAPYQAPESAIDEYRAVPDKLRRTYMGMITALDVPIGRIVAELDKKELRDNTIILFASDNGEPLVASLHRVPRAMRSGAPRREASSKGRRRVMEKHFFVARQPHVPFRFMGRHRRANRPAAGQSSLNSAPVAVARAGQGCASALPGHIWAPLPRLPVSSSPARRLRA
jgi:arylsulfatase A-like enzyme